MITNLQRFSTLSSLFLASSCIIFLNSAVTEVFSLFLEQGAVFLLVFYKIPFLAILPLTFYKIKPMITLQIMVLCAVVAPSWNSLNFSYEGVSAPLHSFVLVFTVTAYTLTLEPGNSRWEKFLPLYLFFFIVIGGFWVFYNASTFALWSWDPVELSSLYLLITLILWQHSWNIVCKPLYFAAAVAVIRFFRLGPALSSHHLVNNSVVYEQTEIEFYVLTENQFTLAVFCFSAICVCCFSLKALYYIVAAPIHHLKINALPHLTIVALAWLPLIYPLFGIALMLIAVYAFFLMRLKFLLKRLYPHILPFTITLLLFYGYLTGSCPDTLIHGTDLCWAALS